MFTSGCLTRDFPYHLGFQPNVSGCKSIIKTPKQSVLSHRNMTAAAKARCFSCCVNVTWEPVKADHTATNPTGFSPWPAPSSPSQAPLSSLLEHLNVVSVDTMRWLWEIIDFHFHRRHSTNQPTNPSHQPTHQPTSRPPALRTQATHPPSTQQPKEPSYITQCHRPVQPSSHRTCLRLLRHRRRGLLLAPASGCRDAAERERCERSLGSSSHPPQVKWWSSVIPLRSTPSNAGVLRFRRPKTGMRGQALEMSFRWSHPPTPEVWIRPGNRMKSGSPGWDSRRRRIMNLPNPTGLLGLVWAEHVAKNTEFTTLKMSSMKASQLITTIGHLHWMTWLGRSIGSFQKRSLTHKKVLQYDHESPSVHPGSLGVRRVSEQPVSHRTPRQPTRAYTSRTLSECLVLLFRLHILRVLRFLRVLCFFRFFHVLHIFHILRVLHIFGLPKADPSAQMDRSFWRDGHVWVHVHLISHTHRKPATKWIQ